MTAPTVQHFTSPRFGVVTFRDHRQARAKQPCQPRDIEIVQGSNSPAMREEIAIDIRIGQGRNAIGAARNLLHNN